MRVVIVWVEDEVKLLDECKFFLEQEGFQVVGAMSYDEAIQRIKDTKPELLIVDWMLPGVGNGLDLCKINEREWKLPIIMVTAKSDEFDKVLALELGADDYIQKPFGLRELSARIKAVMRRSRRSTGQSQAVTEQAEGTINRGRLVIRPDSFSVKKNDLPVELTRTEFLLLWKLAAHPGRVYTRSHLLEEALGNAYLGFERTIDSHIRNLRHKIEDNQAEPEYILTVYGVGYKFNEEAIS
ncbi:DNA-binding response OmpR family regulator [Paenibacillus baekrokdamisoli]|uniref:response regulator transcription factor n=1 Tax=Paenibacillus baekrokdamisoli TaxID=1712516 RepID=UPI0017917D53|nr:response regulator transcription factor [Paenibacillus baekrokdamisoli]MBB3070145.1 DNA-binding response OmpR family regulator [Paenibacillus baekrokdamisoli]